MSDNDDDQATPGECGNCGADHPFSSDICPGCGLSGGQ